MGLCRIFFGWRTNGTEINPWETDETPGWISRDGKGFPPMNPSGSSSFSR